MGCQNPSEPVSNTLEKGKSNQYDLIPYTGVETDAWGLVHYDVTDGVVYYVVNVKGLEPGEMYGLYSQGVQLAVGTANGGGNITFNGYFTPTGPTGRFNLWTNDEPGEPYIKGNRLLWTGDELLPFAEPVKITLEKGKSNQYDLIPYTGVETDAWGLVHYDVTDGVVYYVVNVKDLEPGEMYGLYSQGVLLAVGVANGGENITFNGNFVPTGPTGRFNLWTDDEPGEPYIKGDRMLWTGDDVLSFE